MAQVRTNVRFKPPGTSSPRCDAESPLARPAWIVVPLKRKVVALPRDNTAHAIAPSLDARM